MKLQDIHWRDPFILASKRFGKYYLYGTTGQNLFQVCTSINLEEWSEPQTVFEPPVGFWGTRDFWAPEVHCYNGVYFLFASFKSENACRGTQIFASEFPTGPFVPLTKTPVTPASWECLDGTLFVDEKGAPWMVFVHEYCQMPGRDGTIEAMPLSCDLCCAMGEPRTLFRASDAKWTRPLPDEPGTGGCITDGPFIYREDGKLRMLWSGFTEGRCYVQAVAESSTGEIGGPWIQKDKLLFDNDGGHGMRFMALDGSGPYVVMHCPNSKTEHPILMKIDE